MDALDAIRTRRSIRKYLDKPVPEDVLRQVLGAAMHAPSACNQQPWQFVVLDDRNCSWSKDCIGMPTVIAAGRRLALLYDGPGAKSVSHMRRNIGLAWLDLPLVPPKVSETEG